MSGHTQRVVLGIAVLAVLAAGFVVAGSLQADDVPAGRSEQRDGRAAESARAFLDRYVDDDGRVVRHDQGGDTVSEGQAYALLLAVGVHDEERFDRVWSWTRANLRRPDGLLSWHWRDGAVVDDESASDADLDAARALVLAGQVFEEDRLVEDGTELGKAVLDHETVRLGDGRLLLPGSWSDRRAPYQVNPSYFSPVATRVLHEATGDDRWQELELGSRRVTRQLVGDGQLPPDWAEVDGSGAARPTTGPVGQPEVFGYEAARVLLRHAESCTEADRAMAAGLRDLLGGDDRALAVYDLAGSPSSDWSDPLAYAARAASHAAAGQEEKADRALELASALGRDRPSYYGDAWAALGWMLLADGSLGGCPGEVA